MRLAWLALLVGTLPTSLSAAGSLFVRAPGYDWQSGDYTTTHVFVDEVAGTSAAILRSPSDMRCAST